MDGHVRLVVRGLVILLGGFAWFANAGREYQETYTVDHTYYTMSLYQNNAENQYEKHWVNMSDSHLHHFLSNHSQAAEKIEPGFIFPFYGHLVHNFYVTTHGFLSFAPHLHNLMYKTQYVAPLRVKLDPSRFEESTVSYKVHGDFGNTLTIEWRNVTVAEPYEHPLGGKFTFQATLHANGDIVFVYIFVPELLTTDALYDGEPVAGLSDAFLLHDSELHVYHTLNVDNTDIRTKTVIVFHAKPTCIRQTSCDACTNLAKTSEFACSWCPAVHRCSDGADRLREHWDENECAYTNITTAEQCSDELSHTEWRNSMVQHDRSGSNDSSAGSGTVVSAVISSILVLILIGVGAVFIYLYGRNNPGGIAERIAMRLESSYNRFGIGDEDRIELGKSDHNDNKNSQNNNNNNNNNGASSSSPSELNSSIDFNQPSMF